MTQKVWDEEYDEEFEDFVQAAVKQEGEVLKEMAPVKGFKNVPPAQFIPKDELED